MHRIIYIGNFGPDHSTENHYARSLRILGHEVTEIQENSANAIALAERECAAHDADLLLYTRTWGLHPDRFKRMLKRTRRRGVVSAAVHLDIWHGLARVDEVRTQAMFAMDHVFTADGEHEAEFAADGINHHWLRPGVYGPECYDAERERMPWDVAFVGSKGYHPEWPHRPRLIEWLRETYGDRFVHVGGDGDHPGKGVALRGEALNTLYASVPIIVGDSCFATRTSRYWSDRFYETWGRGGFLIFPHIEALASEVGLAYPAWNVGEWGNLRNEIDYWLSRTPGERMMQRLRIADTVRTKCTYTQRAAELLDVVFGEDAP